MQRMHKWTFKDWVRLGFVLISFTYINWRISPYGGDLDHNDLMKFGCKALAATAVIASCSTNIKAASIPKEKNVKPCTQLRLALAGNNDMTVSWNTVDQQKPARLCYGTEKQQLENCVAGHSLTYKTSTTWNNHVKLSPLEPDTKYYYHIDGDNKNREFTTAPELGSSDEWTFAFVADLGTMGKMGLSTKGDDGEGWALDPGEENTIQALEQAMGQYDFLWQAGDLAYADYWLKEQLAGYIDGSVSDGVQLYELILNQFYEQMSSITGKVPFMVGPGNHEANCNNGGSGNYTSSICVEGQTNFTGLQTHYRMPNEESGGKLNMWYSWDYGNVHFVQFNTETDLGEGLQSPDEKGGEGGHDAGPFGSYKNEQQDWLRNDLKNVNRTKTPWVIAAGHRPWYVAAKDDNVCTECQKAFEDIFNEYNVDLVLFGHVHNFERFKPIDQDGNPDKNGLNNPTSPWYLVNGAGGHYDGLDGIKEDKAPVGYETGIDDTYGWSKITVHNRTHLTHEFVRSDDNKVLDSATLFKEHSF